MEWLVVELFVDSSGCQHAFIYIHQDGGNT
jgi:hypothetical protein